MGVESGSWVNAVSGKVVPEEPEQPLVGPGRLNLVAFDEGEGAGAAFVSSHSHAHAPLPGQRQARPAGGERVRRGQKQAARPLPQRRGAARLRSRAGWEPGCVPGLPGLRRARASRGAGGASGRSRDSSSSSCCSGRSRSGSLLQREPPRLGAPLGRAAERAPGAPRGRGGFGWTLAARGGLPRKRRRPRCPHSSSPRPA